MKMGYGALMSTGTFTISLDFILRDFLQTLVSSLEFLCTNCCF